ncbi:MAG: ScpA family protein, partial [Amphiplicatus sp.]
MTEETLIAEPPAEAEEPFDAPVRGEPSPADSAIDALIVNLDGYEGPLDILLELARTQRVDIRKISMLALVEQYLAFIEAARVRDLELAADYLVMAAWLAFLKSKLLLPVIGDSGDEPTADEMAARLAFQLQRLEAMRKAADALLHSPQLGINVFPRGAPEGVRVRRKS